MNFSQGGASNRYIARTLVTQCNAHVPDLVVAHFTYITRTEYLFPPESISPNWPHVHASAATIGLWHKRASWFRHWFNLRRLPKDRRRLALAVWHWARRYYENYSDVRALYETLSDIMLVQQFCYARKIPLLVCCVDHRKVREASASENLAISTLHALVAPGLLDFAVSDLDTIVDRAADNAHPGPVSNRLFAEKLWSAYRTAGPSAYR
jgi:hypothetical protein